MKEIFLQIVHMSILSSYVILVVLMVRMFLKRCPKIFSYALWAIVFVRLVCPITLESSFSFMPRQSLELQTVGKKQGQESYSKVQFPQVTTESSIAVELSAQQIPSSIPEKESKKDPIQIVWSIVEIIWISGMILLSFTSIIQSIRLHKHLEKATHSNENIFIMDEIDTPFVFGIVKPKIYLPSYLRQSEKAYILLHEQTHISRKDHIIKLIAYLLLCIHWMNPLMWIAFYQMSKDMELSCDESVIRQLGSGIKKEYSKSLLSMTTRGRIVGAGLLAFGEHDTKSRIKNVLNYKKASITIVIIAMTVIVLLGFCLLTNPKTDLEGDQLVDPYAIAKELHDNGMVTVEDKEKNPLSLAKTSEETLTELFNELTEKTKLSSAPQAYIKENPEVFDQIVGYGRDTLLYSFQRFEQGGQTDLNGQFMMYACRKIQTESDDETVYATGQDWYDEFKKKALELKKTKSIEVIEKNYPTYYVLLTLLENPQKKEDTVVLSDYIYSGEDEILKLVYDTEVRRDTSTVGFYIPAIQIYGTYTEENRLKVIATIYRDSYVLQGKQVHSVGGAVLPVAITYKKLTDGRYQLEEYVEPKDGAEYDTSIEKFCTYPISGRIIPGLAHKVLENEGKNDGISKLGRANLIEHLNRYKISGISLVTEYDDSVTLLN